MNLRRPNREAFRVELAREMAIEKLEVALAAVRESRDHLNSAFEGQTPRGVKDAFDEAITVLSMTKVRLIVLAED